MKKNKNPFIESLKPFPKKKPKEIKFIENGKEVITTCKYLHYEHVVFCFLERKPKENEAFTITYKLPRTNYQGIITKDSKEKVEIKEGMVVNVSDTSKA